MKKMTKRTLSLLLVVAMICSLGVMALADTTPAYTGTLTLSANSGTASSAVSVANYVGDTTKLTPTVDTAYSNNSGKIYWSASPAAGVTFTDSTNNALSTDTNGAAYTTGSESVTVTSAAAGTVTVTATAAKSATENITATCTFTISGNTISSFKIMKGSDDVSGKTVYAPVGSTISLTAAAAYNNSKTPVGTIAWAVSNSGVLTGSGSGNSASYTISAAGAETVTATWTDSTISGAAGTRTASVIIKSRNVTAVAVTQAKNLTSVAAGDTLALTAAPTGSDKKAVTDYSSAVWASSDTKIATVTGSGLTGTVLGKAQGKADITCTIDGVVSNAYTVTVTGASRDVKASATLGYDLSMSGVKATLVSNFYTIYGVSLADTQTITLKSLGSSSYGTLYTDNAKRTPAKAGDFTLSALSAMVFSPSAVGDYSISYTLTDPNNASNTMTGNIVISVANVAVNTTAAVPAGGSAFTMTDTNGYTASSVESQLTSRIANLSYVVFNTTTATGTGYGTFSAVNNTQYYVGTSVFSTPHLSSVTFTPGSTAGTYTIGYTAYGYATSSSYSIVQLAVGTLTITVKDAATGTGDISYNVKAGASVSLTDSDFETWYESQTSASYSLISVRFNSLPSAGTMKYSGSSSTLNFNTSTDYYTSGNGTGLSPKYLANVSYTAPSTAGNYAVSFTCTGKYGSSTRTVNGTLLFCVNKGTVADISYKVVAGQNLSLAESDFTSVYKTATSSTATSPKFTIRFVSVPSKGTLYRDGYTTSGYKVTAGSTSYYVNAAIATAYDVDDLTYVPGNYTTGSETIIYQAYDAAGTLQYTGNIIFTYTTNTKAMSCYSEGYTFAKGDFVSSSDTDPVSYVTFTGIGAGGSLYRDYNYGKGYSVGTSMKFYMSSSVSGGYPITSLTFIPKAEYIGNVAIKYTAVTKAGKTSTGTINMYCDARTSALKFNDVNASWAVPAVDFTSCWGLVTGSGGGTFNPTGTMQRAMLVTILYRMAGSPSVAGMSNPFKDVPAGTWYTNAVIWASHNGVVNGTGKTTFSPTNPVARQDIAAILWRYEGQPSGSSYALNGYADAGSVSSYAKSAMQWAVGAGIITGSGSRLNPQASGTRAEVCVMLYRLLAA